MNGVRMRFQATFFLQLARPSAPKAGPFDPVCLSRAFGVKVRTVGDGASGMLTPLSGTERSTKPYSLEIFMSQFSDAEQAICALLSLIKRLRHIGTQVGAIPVRGASSAYKVLMITSRDSGRWIIPKGWPMKGKKDHLTAAQEAFDEAGVSGKIQKRPLGAYTYGKRIEGADEPVRVMVYLLEVSEERQVWPEKDQRRREWMHPEEAAALVAEPGLATLLLRIGAGAKPLS